MRRVLLLAYHFPPVGGPGVQRAVKFARYLRDLGYEPVIVTGPDNGAAMTDRSLARELPADIEVHRVAGPEPDGSERWRGRLERWSRRDSAWTRWWRAGSLDSGSKAANIDLVFTTMSPFQSALPAAGIAQALGVPWVADLRDPWALDEMRVYQTSLHRKLDLRAMRRELSSAAGIVMNTPEAASALRSAFPELAGKTVAIPNGFDADDFSSAQPVPPDESFRIVHAGLLHTGLGQAHRRHGFLHRLLGGSLGDIDILPRSHVFLLRAVDELADARPEIRSSLEVHLVGWLSESDVAAIDSDLVRSHGYLPHGRCLELVRTADLLFLPMHGLAAGHRARIVPGKTYEYLASGRPILAAVPDGDARDLITPSGNAHVCSPTDVDAMARVIASEFDRFTREGHRATLGRTSIQRFERRRLTAHLANAFDRILAGQPVAGDLDSTPPKE